MCLINMCDACWIRSRSNITLWSGIIQLIGQYSKLSSRGREKIILFLAISSIFAISCRYAYDILELEELNRRLEDHLSVVQAYSKELSLEQGLEGGDSSQETKSGCELEAQVLYDKRSKEFKYTVQSEPMANLITKLTALLLQLKVLFDTLPVTQLQVSREIRSMPYYSLAHQSRIWNLDTSLFITHQKPALLSVKMRD